MGVSTLCAWLRGHPGKETSGGTGFVALPNLGVTVAAPRAYRLEFADPMVLEIPTGFGAQDLARLLGVLRDL